MFRVLLAATVLAVLALPASANPTGAPLAHYPVEPCRVLDTRFALGPIAHNTGINVFIRGAALPATQGGTQTDCGVPVAAESAIINVAVVQPTSEGYLRLNGTGFVHGPKGPYSRINFAAGQTISNEMSVSLCNVFIYPAPHAPCLFDTAGHYLDFDIQPKIAVGASVHVVIDVVGYLARDGAE
jgi:hypothetical protein